jgi:hypothetical protein
VAGRNLPSRFLRTKRWDYWAITTEQHLLMVLVADVGYLGLAAVSLLEPGTGRRFESVALTPFALGMRLPPDVHGTPIRFDHLGVRIHIEAAPRHVAIRASARSLGGERLEVDISVEPPLGFEPLDVVVPFGGGRSQFTSKRIGLPATGRVSWGDRVLAFDEAAASLDFGRGVWPYRTSWYWAAASGIARGRRVALNLGGVWTDGTGETENALWLDGRLHRIRETVTFVATAPAWRIESERVRLRVDPVHTRALRLNLGLIAARLDWRMARLSGTFSGDDGTSVAVENLLGWAERFDARW